ncbi:MAG: SH3 domain-containing protein [Lachnospiraceae bacterium]|nr:SH3 domain-containing protein [Lachnospiraceae bacterium]
MDNRKKKRNKQKSDPNTNNNTEVLNTEEGKSNNTPEKKEDSGKSSAKAIQKNTDEKVENRNTKEQRENEKPGAQKTAALQKNEKPADNRPKPDNTKNENNISKKETPRKEELQKENTPKENSSKGNSSKESIPKENIPKESTPKEDSRKERVNQETKPASVNGKTVTDVSSEQIKGIAMNAAKILLPVAACAIIIAVVISYISSRKSQTVDNLSLNTEERLDTAGAVTLSDEPLAENAYANVNELMQTFCTALADGDMDVVRALKDYNTDREIITYEKKSEFIERYDNINCYTKPGMEENSYFVYVTYDVKFKDIETEAPGLNAFYVYTADDGSLKIDGDTEENIKAAFKLVTNQDDVVDLYNEINVDYTEATASDEVLAQFMTELPVVIKESVGVALAQLETQEESGDTPQTEAGEVQPAETSVASEEELPQNQVVNQIVRTTDTVNVRSSDSEEADKIGKAQAGTELKRVEDRVNGWSKVIFEDKEAYIKSDYLEVVTTQETAQAVSVVTATTNVNVRSQASQESERIGSAQTGTSYTLLEDQGEWYKIDFNGTTGFVKAEFFER